MIIGLIFISIIWCL